MMKLALPRSRSGWTRSTLGILLSGAAATLFASTPAPTQEFTRAEFEPLIREAHALVERHGPGRLPRAALVELNRLALIVGLPEHALPPEARPPPVVQPDTLQPRVDAVASTLAPADGLALMVRWDLEAGDRHRFVNRFLRSLVSAGRAHEALEAAAEHDLVGHAFGVILTFGPRSETEAFLRDWLAATALPESQEMEARVTLLERISVFAPDRALAEIRSDPRPTLRARSIADFLVRHGRGDPDSVRALLAEGIGAAREIDDADERRANLVRFHEVCTFHRLRACDGFDLPLSRPALDRVANGFQSAHWRLELAAADSLLAILLEEGYPEPALLTAITRALEHCNFSHGCRSAHAPLRERWMERLEAFAATPAPEADTVRAALVRIWAPLDAGAALRWLERVESPELAWHAAHIAMQTAYAGDFFGAVAIVREMARRGMQVWVLPGRMYVRLRGLGEHELAEALTTGMESRYGRLRSRLGWASVLHRAGRIDDARETALFALEGWNPEIDPIALGGAMLLMPFAELGLYDALLTWARQWPEGPVRAGALISLVSSADQVWQFPSMHPRSAPASLRGGTRSAPIHATGRLQRLAAAAGAFAGALAASPAVAPGLPARQEPDTAQARALMREAHALLQEHGTGRLSVHFIDQFNRQAAAYGLPPLTRPSPRQGFRPSPVEEVVDTLAANRGVDHAWTRAQLNQAVREGDLATADSLLAALAALGIGEAARYTVVGDALTRCLDTAECARRPPAELVRWRARMEAAAHAPGWEADAVRAQLVQLWAADDAPRALRWLEAVEDTALAAGAGFAAGRLIRDLDFRAAVELLRAGPRGAPRLSGLPQDMYLRLHSQSQGELAEELLGLVGSSAYRLVTRLERVRQLHGAGKVAKATDLVFTAFADWDPEADPLVCWNCLQIVAAVGVYDDLIAWARALPDSPAKASALVTIALGRVVR